MNILKQSYHKEKMKNMRIETLERAIRKQENRTKVSVELHLTYWIGSETSTWNTA